jgi:hypothetical protein
MPECQSEKTRSPGLTHVTILRFLWITELCLVVSAEQKIHSCRYLYVKRPLPGCPCRSHSVIVADGSTFTAVLPPKAHPADQPEPPVNSNRYKVLPETAFMKKVSMLLYMQLP